MKTLIYTFDTPATIYIAKELMQSGKISALILQNPMSTQEKIKFLKYRLKKRGPFKVIDEILFKVYYDIFLKREDEGLRKRYFPPEFFDTEIKDKNIPVYNVDSINSGDGVALLRRLSPDLVVMESREMIGGEALSIPRIGFIGCHPGIIPEYRGVYASFWAMADNAPDKVGISVYLADRGVDTGGIVSQKAIKPKFKISNFKVESERLMIEGIKDMIDTIAKAERGSLDTYKKSPASSRVFTHIGLSDYLKAIYKKV